MKWKVIFKVNDNISGFNKIKNRDFDIQGHCVSFTVLDQRVWKNGL